MDHSLARNETCSGTKFYVYWCYGFWVLWVQQQEEEEEEEEEKEVEHGQNGKNSFSCNLDIKWSFHEMFGTQFSFHMLCSTDSLEVI